MQICASPTNEENITLTIQDLQNSNDASLNLGDNYYVLPKIFYDKLENLISKHKTVSRQVVNEFPKEFEKIGKVDCSNLVDGSGGAFPFCSNEDNNNMVNGDGDSNANHQNNLPVILKKEILEGSDFTLVTEILFHKINAIIGLENQHRDKIKRPVSKNLDGTKSIDLYPHNFEIRKLVPSVDSADKKKWVESASNIIFQISSRASVADLYKKIRELFNLCSSSSDKIPNQVDKNAASYPTPSIPGPPAPPNLKDFVLYFRYNKPTSKDAKTGHWKYVKITDPGSPKKGLDELGVDSGCTFVIDLREFTERKDSDVVGHVTVLKSASSTSSSNQVIPTMNGNSSITNGNTSKYLQNKKDNPKSVFNNRGNFTSNPGQVGLDNLGNTCFMASGLQCISNVPVLTEFFLSGQYIDEINEDNPIGCNGKLAEEYARLLSQLWDGSDHSVAPRQFKQMIGRWNSRFVGYQQQDSHEFLNALIDGIHEDLNRIKKKPYVEIKDADGRPDEEVSSESWTGHKARNDSVIVDNFHGQYKSTVRCPTASCGYVSVTFDPFIDLSLPVTKNTSSSSIFNGLKEGGKAIFGLAKRLGQNVKDDTDQISVLFVPYFVGWFCWKSRVYEFLVSIFFL